jgi:hypothetical protein
VEAAEKRCVVGEHSVFTALFACLGCPAYVTPERTVPLRSVARVLLHHALPIRGGWRRLILITHL